VNQTQAQRGVIAAAGEDAFGRRDGWARRLWHIVRSNPLGDFGAALILLLVVVGIFAPLISPYAINGFAGVPNAAPSQAHIFGTDKLGQDIFSRVVSGARISLEVGFFSVGLASLIGMSVGVASGYIGGTFDAVVQRIVDTTIAFPQLILLLMVIRVLGPSLTNVVIVIAIGVAPPVARIIRGAVLSERRNAYIEAARATGASGPRIMLRHLAPNVLPLAIVIATTLLGGAILAEAALSFLGLGIPPPSADWGADIANARTSFPLNTWAALFPGLAISLTVLGFNLLGDSLRDILDPRLRGSR
jgi:peptide/nickel transport system permease protein